MDSEAAPSIPRGGVYILRRDHPSRKEGGVGNRAENVRVADIPDFLLKCFLRVGHLWRTIQEILREIDFVGAVPEEEGDVFDGVENVRIAHIPYYLS